MVGNPSQEPNEGAVLRGASGPYLFAALSRGISRSSDNGMTWASTEFPKTLFANAMAVSGGKVVAGGCGETSPADCGIHISSDSGATWKATAYQGSSRVSSLAMSGSDIWAGTEKGGISHSSGSGATWTPPSFPGGSAGMVKALAVSGANLLAGTDNGLFLSSDKGTTWRKAMSYPAWQLVVSDTDVVAQFDYDAYRSTDNGENWTRILTRVMGALGTTGDRIIAGIGDSLMEGSILYSSDKGSTWSKAGEGWGGLSCQSIVVCNGYLFTTDGQGRVWRLPLSALSL